jgi:phosphoribosylformylglycinamidine synthase
LDASELRGGGLQPAEFSSSEYSKVIHGIVAGKPPAIDLAAEKNLIDCLVKLAAERAIVSAHDISDGGLAVTLAESCFDSDSLSADIRLDASGLPAEAALFGERVARVVVSLSPASLARVNEIAAQYKVRVQQIGTVIRGEFRIQHNGVSVIQGRVDIFRRIWAESLEQMIEGGS